MATAKPKTPAPKKSSARTSAAAPAKAKRPPAKVSRNNRAPVVTVTKTGAGSKGPSMEAIGPRFTPITPIVVSAFLSVVAGCGNITQACDELRINRGSIYQMRQENEEFRLALAEALTTGYDAWEDAAARRAFVGYEKPVFQQGMQVGETIEYSDTLAALLLKGSKPEKYKERSSSEVSVSGRLSVQLEKLSDEELNQLIDAKLIALGVSNGSQAKTR